jgi:hypothetical protein
MGGIAVSSYTLSVLKLASEGLAINTRLEIKFAMAVYLSSWKKETIPGR